MITKTVKKPKIYPKTFAVLFASTLTAPVALANNDGSISFSKQWTKEELHQKPKQLRDPDIIDMISNYTKSMIIQIGNNQNSTERGFYAIQKKSQEMSKEEYLVRLGTMTSIQKDTNGDTSALIKYTSAEVQTIASNQIKAQLTFLNAINNGLNFELSSDLFKSKNAKSHKIQKYGLILQDIKHPVEKRDSAAINNDMEQELSFATEAEPVWSIGPLPQDKKTLFNLNNKTVKKNSFVPDFRFKGKVAPTGDFVKDIQDKKNANLKYSLVQSQGFYEISHITRNKAGIAETYQVFTLPLIATLSLQKKYDIKGLPLETRANGLLLDSKLPTLNVIFDHRTEKYAAEAKYSYEKHNVSFEAKDVIELANDKKKYGTYKVNYSLSI